ncbi:unnamed protein product [Urochloa humidicola]
MTVKENEMSLWLGTMFTPWLNLQRKEAPRSSVDAQPKELSLLRLLFHGGLAEQEIHGGQRRTQRPVSMGTCPGSAQATCSKQSVHTRTQHVDRHRDRHVK